MLSSPGDTPVFPEDPEYRELEGADDTDADAEAHELGEALRTTGTTNVPAESTVGIKLASATERVAAAKVEALGPREEGEARHGRGVLPRKRERRPDALRGGKGKVDALGQGDPGEGNTAT